MTGLLDVLPEDTISNTNIRTLKLAGSDVA